MIYFLDTNICVYHLNDKYPQITERLQKISSAEIAIPSIVVAELFYGAEKSGKRQQNLIKYNTFVSKYNCISFNDNAARIYGKIRADLERIGQVIGDHDMQIAATVLAYGKDAILVTNNTEEFSRINRLHCEDWTV